MRIYIETLGCPKNWTDSENAAGLMAQAGHRIVDDPAEADAILVNTCGFIQDAKEESIDRILSLAEEKTGGRRLLVSGCLSQRYGKDLQKEIPEVDVFLGVNEYHRLPDILDALDREAGSLHLDGPPDFYKELPARKRLGPSFTSYLKIAEGCDNHCAYCSIPGIRGGYRSRSIERVAAEAVELVGQGCKELILVAQDVTAYGVDLYGAYRLPELVRELCRIPGLQWLRLMYCYEDRITDELIEAIKENPKVCRYIDVPIQHASDRILESMGRRSTKASISETIRRLRAAMPDIHIRSTLITGFPGETDADFQELLAFVQEQKLERLGVFAYSKEEGTAAALMRPQVPAAVKQRRKDRIMEAQRAISLEKNRSLVGQTLEVLIEGEEDGVYVGRSRYDAPEIDNAVLVSADLPLAVGDLVTVTVTDAFDYDLSAKLVAVAEQEGTA